MRGKIVIIIVCDKPTRALIKDAIQPIFMSHRFTYLEQPLVEAES